MKTAYNPDSLSAVLSAIQSAAIANPALAFGVVVIASAAFATWAVKNL